MKSLVGTIAVGLGLVTAALPTQAAVMSLDLNGASDYVGVSDNASIDVGTSDLTLEAWVKTTQGDGYYRVISKGHYGTTPGYMLQVSKNGKVLGGISGGTAAAGYWAYADTPTVNDGAWHHVAVVFDRSATSGATAYIDGRPFSMTVGGGTWATDRNGNVANASNLRIGAYDGGTSENYNGLVDEVQVWTEARTWRQIRQSAFGRPSATDPNLAAYWDFDGNLNDQGPNANYGTWSTGNNSQATYSTDAAPLAFALAQPVAHWQFGEAEDISYDIDRTPAASDLTNHWTGDTLKMNQPETVIARGSDNRVLKENGSYSFAAVAGGNTELDITGPVSIFARVKSGQFNGVDDIARCDVSATENQYALEFQNGVPVFRVRGAGKSADTLLQFDQAVSAGVWYDIVGIFEPGSTGSSTMYLYVTDSQTAALLGMTQQTVDFSALIDLAAGTWFHVLESPGNANGDNVGFELEQLAVWNVPLSDMEVLGLSVPEPGSAVLLLLGIVGLILVRPRVGQ
jgi:hypothetical protein